MRNTHPLCVGTALLSVSDKTNIVPFAKTLSDKNIRIISTGGTAKLLKEHGIKVTPVSDITRFPEMMEGRVKTLHPNIHGGILGKRDLHVAEAQKQGIGWIDLVVCNLYPFAKTIAESDDVELAIENIDIGGPSMIRAAAKNIDWVTVITDQKDYDAVLEELDRGISFETRQQLSAKAFDHTAHYDSIIARYFSKDSFPQEYTLGASQKQLLRYGENPHQQAAWYTTGPNPFNQQLQGKPLSFNNLADSSAALSCLQEFTQPACVIVKHANPCGAALGKDIDQAFKRAWEADSKSAFGGIVALNQRCTQHIAEHLSQVFVEVILAPGFSEAALAQFQQKKNVRLLDTSDWNTTENAIQIKPIMGGFLLQTADQNSLDFTHITQPTQAKPSEQQLKDMQFAWQVVKHLKSNAILIAQDAQTLGVGCGQVSRVDAVDIAIQKMGSVTTGCVLASDAFFPFRDSIDLIAKAGIKAIIQPGGSVRDQEVIDACDEHGIAMVLTGTRCFNH